MIEPRILCTILDRTNFNLSFFSLSILIKAEKVLALSAGQYYKLHALRQDLLALTCNVSHEPCNCVQYLTCQMMSNYHIHFSILWFVITVFYLNSSQRLHGWRVCSALCECNLITIFSTCYILLIFPYLSYLISLLHIL